MLHTFNFNAHLASLAGKNAGGAFRVFRVEVREFGVDLKNLVAAIGPSIGPCCYEVDDVVYEQGKNYYDCFMPTTVGHWRLDLWRMNELQLLEKGLLSENILRADVCTEDNKELFFSYRGENGKTGRLAAVIFRK